METAISAFCKSLAAFCSHAESSSRTLSDSIQRRAIPLDSATVSFLKSLNRRVSSTSADLDLLESMAFDTVSFEELLGHCSEVHKINLKYISEIEEHMISFGYVPEIKVDEEEEEGEMDLNLKEDLKCLSCDWTDQSGLACASFSARQLTRKILDDDSLFDDSMHLRNLGLSDASLAILSSQGANIPTSTKKMSLRDIILDDGQLNDKAGETKIATNGIKLNSRSGNESTLEPNIRVSKDEYNELPPYMKSLISWEELEVAITKLNSFFCEGKGEGNSAFNQDESEKIGLGRKGRSCLLILLRLNRLIMETIDGSNYYRLNDSFS